MRTEAFANILLSLLSFFAAVLLLAIIFLCGYFFGFFVADVVAEVYAVRPSPLKEIVEFTLGTSFLVLLFFNYLRELRIVEEFRKPMVEHVPGRTQPFIFWRESRNILVDDRRIIDFQSFFFFGPACLRFSLVTFRKALRQWRLDVKRCASILEIVARRGHRVSFAELEKAIPDANRFHVFEQLRDIDGIVFLIREPAGISLIEDLRHTLLRLLDEQQKARPQFTAPRPPPEPEPLTELELCFQMLGLESSAPLAEIKRAYRKKIKECHPDRFTRFGKDWQKLAEEKSKQLNAAYDKIMEESVIR
jgi:hypothetical protein